MKLAIVDIDGVVADSTVRFQQATIDGKIDWDKALNSNALHLDTLIPHAAKHLELIAARYDQTVLLTSRYDHMRAASLIWLAEHKLTKYYERAIFKPWDDRYTKTKLWKAQQVMKLLREHSEPGLFNAPQDPVTDLLIVEDEEQNRVTIQEEVARWIMSNRQMRARYFVSLQDAAKAIQSEVSEYSRNNFFNTEEN